MQIGVCNLEHHGQLGIEAHQTRRRVIRTYIEVQPIHPGPGNPSCPANSPACR